MDDQMPLVFIDTWNNDMVTVDRIFCNCIGVRCFTCGLPSVHWMMMEDFILRYRPLGVMEN